MQWIIKDLPYISVLLILQIFSHPVSTHTPKTTFSGNFLPLDLPRLIEVNNNNIVNTASNDVNNRCKINFDNNTDFLSENVATIFQ